MAYGIKYRFRFYSEHGVLHTVNISKDGYSGSVTERPLGKAPVIRMQDGTPFRSTSCNLVLECRTDGEFAELYTSNPKEFQVDVFRGGTLNSGGTLVWEGFVATEIYSEPDIAPPYDVAVTATDGLGTLKEYNFEARGLKTVREQFAYLLGRTGLRRPVYCATSAGPTSGTPATLFDSVSINMDYMVGESCYDVLAELLRSFHFTLTQYGGSWLILRETDVADKITSAGALNVYSVPTGSGSSTTTTTISNVRKTVGKMGVANVWPIGFLTRRVVPAKKELTIEAPWHKMNAAPSVAADGWSKNEAVTHYPDPGFYTLGKQISGLWTEGDIYSTIAFSSFQADINIGIKYNPSEYIFGIQPVSSRKLRVRVIWESGGTMYHYNEADGWVAGTEIVYLDSIPLDNVQKNTGHDPALAVEATYSIPAYGGTSSGTFTIVVSGLVADVYDVSLEVGLNKGYKDILVLNNGARGKDEERTITGGRALYGYLNQTSMYGGLFVWTSDTGTAVYDWADNRNYGKNFVSLAALDYALSVAVPRVELSGKIDLPSGLTVPPMVLSLRSVLHQLKTYDWDLLNDEVSFTAVSSPAASVTVTSETVISIPND